MRAGEGALPDEPDKENVLGRLAGNRSFSGPPADSNIQVLLRRHEGSDAAGGTLAQYYYDTHVCLTAPRGSYLQFQIHDSG